LQNDLPKAEEGHFTIMNGEIDIIIFPPDSIQIMQLHTARKNKADDAISTMLDTGSVVDTLGFGAGFGELSTITKLKRSASVRANGEVPSDLLIIPQDALLNCLAHRRMQVVTDFFSFLITLTGYL
jgi:CRP-like cAMP-binding protein